MRRINKRQVLKKCREKGSWQGWIVGNKVAPYHIAGGWHIGFHVKLVVYNGQDYYKGIYEEEIKIGDIVQLHSDSTSNYSIRPLQSFINDWAYYNACWELGYYIAWYEE